MNFAKYRVSMSDGMMINGYSVFGINTTDIRLKYVLARPGYRMLDL